MIWEDSKLASHWHSPPLAPLALTAQGKEAWRRVWEGHLGHSSQRLNEICQEHAHPLTLKTEEDHSPRAKEKMNLLWRCLRWWTQTECKDYPAHCPTQPHTKWPPHWDEAWPARRNTRPTHRKCLLLTKGNAHLSKRWKNLPPKRNYPRSRIRMTQYKTKQKLKEESEIQRRIIRGNYKMREEKWAGLPLRREMKQMKALQRWMLHKNQPQRRYIITGDSIREIEIGFRKSLKSKWKKTKL